jgi:inorganic pyrophosphatase
LTKEPLPERVDVLIEVPKGGFVKREAPAAPGGRWSVDYVSPLPSPYNYGCVPDVPGQDGDPLDAVVLGKRLRAGTRLSGGVVGVVRFWDAGKPDDKLVIGEGTLTEAQRRGLARFFKIYALARSALNMRRGLTGNTEFISVITREEADRRWVNPR